jgi:hypothetical protein
MDFDFNFMKTANKIASEKWEIRLAMDALYFHAAIEAFKEAKSSDIRVKDTSQKLESISKDVETVYTSCSGDQQERNDRIDPLRREYQAVLDERDTAYRQYLQSLAIIHILCAASLENFIYSLSKNKCSRVWFNNFKKLSLEGKWLLLPKILALEGFNPGEQPFQAFSDLVGFRNELIHFKEHKEEWVIGETPSFLKKIGLTLDLAENSISCVRKLVSEVSKQMGNNVPYWIIPGLPNLGSFDVVISNPSKKLIVTSDKISSVNFLPIPPDGFISPKMPRSGCNQRRAQYLLWSSQHLFF